MPRPPRRSEPGRSRSGEGGATPPSPVELAIRYLTPRRRFVHEVRAHLRKRGVRPDEVEAALDRLRELELVDDDETARAYIRDRLEFAPRGPALLRRELRAKGVANETVEAALADTVDAEREVVAALAVLRRADRRGGGRGDAAMRRRRLWSAVARRGFGSAACREALRRHLDETWPDDVEPDPPGADD